MSVLVAALLYVPGIIVGCLLWGRLSRPKPSVRYLGAAVAVAVSGFFAIQFLTLFVLASFGLSKGCADINDCYFEAVTYTFRWWYLGISSIFGALAYLGMRYCAHIASPK